MESRVMPWHAKNGYTLVMVLIITAIGLLFGAGSLLLFRFQCQMRIDRQHELEKVYAVRSALNFIRPFSVQISDRGQPFYYHTNSERDLTLIVRPVEPIFPVATNIRHLVMESSTSIRNFQLPRANQYSEFPEYEYGSTTNCAMGNFQSKNVDGKTETAYGLAFTDVETTNNAIWWVNVGMRDTGGWLEEDYGRRYYFNLVDYFDSASTSSNAMDVIRFCLIRNVTNWVGNADAKYDGRRHGWPLLPVGDTGEWALVFQVGPKIGNEIKVSLSEWQRVGTVTNKWPLLSRVNFKIPDLVPSKGYMGFQLARDKVSLFYIDTYETTEVKFNPYSSGYVFSSVTNLSKDAFNYFARYYDKNGKVRYYDGNELDNAGKRIRAPELRAVFEVQASSSLRPQTHGNHFNFLTDFGVTPAYQYDVFVEHPLTVTNRATVAQKIGVDEKYTVLTYDTHGTEHKGFRYDERHPNGE